MPKPLVKLNGEAMIDRLIRIFVANHAESVSVIVNEEMKEVQEHLKALSLPVPLHLVIKSTPSSMHSFFELSPSLEGGKFCTLVPSGLASVVLVDMALLKAGDELLIPDNAYGPNKAFAQAELAGWGVSFQFYDPMNPADLAARLNAKTRLVWLEAPGSITMEFPDLPALVDTVKAHNASPQAHPPETLKQTLLPLLQEAAREVRALL